VQLSARPLRTVLGVAAGSLLLLAGAAAPTAFAELAVSANDNKMVLVNGVPTIVANPRPDTVAIIDLSAKPPRVLHELNVPSSVVGPPLSVAIAPDESLVLVTAGMRIDPGDPTRQIPDRKLSVIDMRTNPPAVVAELDAGLGAAGVSINRDGTLALVANRSEGSVSVFKIDGHTVRKIDTIQIGTPDSGVTHVAINPNGRSALVTRDGDHTISVLSINGDKVEYTKRDFGVGLKPYGIVISADGQSAVVAHLGLGRGDNDTISLIDLTLNPPRVTETYTVGQTPEGINISPDGKLVAVVTMNGSNKPKVSPFYSPFGRLLLFRLNRGALKLVSDARIGTWPQGAAFSADSKTLLVQSMDERNIMVFSIDEAYRLKDSGQRIPLQGGGAALRTADKPVK